MSRERDSSGDRAADRTEEKQYDPDPKVFVGGIPFSLSPEDIKELFEVHGPVVDMTVSAGAPVGLFRGPSITAWREAAPSAGRSPTGTQQLEGDCDGS